MDSPPKKPMTVFVAVTKQVPTRAIEGTEAQFVTVSPRKFFGFQTYEVYDRSVAISTSEKTVVDRVDRPDLCGVEGSRSSPALSTVREDAFRPISTSHAEQISRLMT